nr:hypothetical protein Ade03nite_91940 [Actinoplanes derwentensis]
MDAFIVRMTLVPAVLHLLGRSAWWLPRWLDRALPDVDIEGAGLARPGGAHLHLHAGDVRSAADADRGPDPADTPRSHVAQGPRHRR